MERDRHVARRAPVSRRRAVRHAATGAVRAVRLVRLGLHERLGSRERDASADDSGVWDERQSVAGESRRAAAAVFPHQARLQDDEVSGVGDVHGRAAGRVLGGSGLPVVRRRVTTGRPLAYWCVAALLIPFGSMRAQLPHPAVRLSVGFGVDTAGVSNHEILTLWRAHLSAPPDCGRPSALWSRVEQQQWPSGDLLCTYVYQGFTNFTLVHLAPAID